MKRNVLWPGALALSSALALVSALPGCKKKVTQSQCDELLDHYASLVVTENAKLKEATPEAIKAEQAREREEAKSDDDFKNCTTELSTEDYSCAMAAKTIAAVSKCLE
jgi:hypothetical protein